MIECINRLQIGWGRLAFERYVSGVHHLTLFPSDVCTYLCTGVCRSSKLSPNTTLLIGLLRCNAYVYRELPYKPT